LKLNDVLQFLQANGKLLELLGINIGFVVDWGIHNVVGQTHKKKNA
jgi:hypothetical protein